MGRSVRFSRQLYPFACGTSSHQASSQCVAHTVRFFVCVLQATKVTTVYLSIFALATPVGILIGLEASKAGSTLPLLCTNAFAYRFFPMSKPDAKLFTIMTALSLGTILYAACEMLFNEFEHFNRLKQEFLKVLCVFLGAGLVFGLTILHLQGGTHVHTS